MASQSIGNESKEIDLARRTKKQLRAEFERLLEIYKVIVDFQRDEMSWPKEIMDLIPNPEDMINDVECGKWTLSQMISGIEEMITDFQTGLNDYHAETHPMLSPAERGPETPKFLSLYKQRTGRDFHRDMTDPAQMVRTVLKRGRIQTDLEYRIVEEFLNDQSQNSFDNDQLAILEVLCAEYGAAPLTSR